jgi:uncharacterized protein (DUF427 family)
VVEGNQYFSLGSIDRDHLKESPTTSVCPWKGVAHYYAIVVDGAVNSDAAWYYPDPKAGAGSVADRVAFWRGVTVSDY